MANIPKRLVFSALIAFSLILLSQEKAFAPLTDPEPAPVESQPQGSDTQTLQIEPNPIVFQVGIDTTTPFDTIELAFGGVSMSSLGLFPYVEPEMDMFISEDDEDISEALGTLYFPPFPKDSRPPPPPRPIFVGDADTEEDEFGV